MEISVVNHAQHLIDSVKQGDLPTVQRILKANPSLVRMKTEHGESLMLLAAYHGRPDIMKYLLSQDTELTIFEACAVGVLARVQELLNGSQDLIRSYSHDGFTALHLAAFFGHKEIVDLLLHRGAEVNAVATNTTISPNVTPLHSAAARNHTEISKMLIDRGANVNAKQSGGWTPLHAAAANDNLALVQFLLLHGADQALMNDRGDTALSIAAEKNHHAIVTHLEHFRL